MRIFVDTRWRYASYDDFHSGVQAYARTHPDWELLVPDWDGSTAEIAGRCDGFIIRHHQHPCLAVRGRRQRTVFLTGEPQRGCLQVWHDDEAIGRVGADYLLGLGFRRFVVRSDPRIHSMHARMQAFTRAAHAGGGDCTVVVPTEEMYANYTVESEQILLTEHLAPEDDPAVLVAYEAICARRLQSVIRYLGYEVPDQMAVFALEDIPLASQVATPPISAVRTAGERIGFAAAEALHRMLEHGDRSPPEPVPPTGITERASTHREHAEDDPVTRALQHIRAAPGIPWRVPELAAQVGVGRRSLERAFAARLGRSPAQEVIRQRLLLAINLLGQTDLPIAAIATRCGFPSHSSFCQAFRRRYQSQPSDYRSHGRSASVGNMF